MIPGLPFVLGSVINMAKKNTVGIVTELTLPIAEKHRLLLWDVAFEKEGASWFLRVYLDRPDGVMSVMDCEKVSRELDARLDELDPISQSYYLEVSSAGLGRKLKKSHHFEAYLGEEVTVKLIRPIENQREFVGILKEHNEGRIVLETPQKDLSFSISDCSYVKLNDDLDLF